MGPERTDCITGTNFAAQYYADEDDAIIEATTRKYIETVNEYTKSVGQFKPFLYMNYAYPTQDVRRFRKVFS
jgi:hypothetical protein